MNDLITAVLAVLTAVGQWIGAAFSDWVFPIFWTAAEDGGGSLTILGVLAIMGFGVGLVFLLIGVVQNFFRMRS